MANLILDIGEELERIEKLLRKLTELEKKTCSLSFISIKEFARLSGWSEPTVQDLFNRADFPSCDFGKTKIAEISAVKKYFSVPRRK